MATTLQMLEQGTAVSLLTTELNSLANNTNVVSSVGGSSGVFDNVQATSNLNAYVRAKVELVLAAYTGTPTASSAVYLWFLKNIDGSNYEDGGSSVTPARNPDAVIPVSATASGPQRVIVECWVPVGLFKVLARNAGTGITFAASGNTVKVKLNTDQGV